jgi:hypothetical protein
MAAAEVNDSGLTETQQKQTPKLGVIKPAATQ